MKFQLRATNMGLAFVDAAAAAIKNTKVPEFKKPEEPVVLSNKAKAEAEAKKLNALQKGHKIVAEQKHSLDKVDHAPWIARRVALNQSHIGMVSEPSWNAHLSLKTYNVLKAKDIM